MSVQIKLVVGSVVKLKSGGPMMTVTTDRTPMGPKYIGVTWFDGSTICEKALPKDAVEPDEATIKAAEKAAKEAQSKDLKKTEPEAE